MRPRFTETVPDYYPLGGGLDLLTPAISMPPGKVISSQNYEPETGGGYKRIKGFERFSGKALPSSKSYWLATVALSGTVAVGDTITGVTSTATGVVIAIESATVLVLAQVTGTFQAESITVGTVSSVTAASASDPSNHADYNNLAADNWRAQIAAITGSGAIRGVWYYGGNWYAFRDNAGGTAGDMWKATGSGWTQVTFGTEIQFSSTTGGTTPIAVGDTIGNLTIGAPPTKTATVVKVLHRAGTWGTDAVGTLIITPVLGTFSNADQIWVGATQKAVATTAATAITRAAGGRLDFFNANFTGSTDTKKMYGADGVNLAFEFDGTNYIPIRTGMTTDTPSHVVVHKNHLMLSFRGSHQSSAIGQPYSWSVVTGASEIGTGDSITGYQIQSGSTTAASLSIFTEGRTFTLYGNSSADWQLTPSGDDIGAFGFCFQSVGNDTMMLTNRGIQRLRAVQDFGNFSYASISDLVQPLITAKRGLQLCSTTLKTRNQYRVFFSDETAITVGLTGNKISGIMPLDYGMPVRCVCTAETTDGAEVTMFGSDDGYVYQDNSGTSFDGEPITAWIRLPFNNLKGPRVRKRYRSAILELVVGGYTELQVTYDLGYGNLDVAQGIAAIDQQLLAAGGYWDSFVWDSFTWDAQAVGNPRVSLDGIEKNISILFYSSRDQDDTHTLTGLTITHSPLRLER